MGIVWKFLPWVDPTSQTPTPTKCTNATLVYCTYCTFYPLSIGLFIGSKCFALTETGILHVYMTCFTCNEQQTCHLGKHFISDGKIYITFYPTEPRRSTLLNNSHQFHPPHPHLRLVTPSTTVWIWISRELKLKILQILHFRLPLSFNLVRTFSFGASDKF